MKDIKQKFLLEDLDIKGSIVSLSSSWQEVLSRKNYSDNVIPLLGEITVSSILMASNIKFEGNIIAQLQSEGALSLLVSQCDNHSNFRSFSKYDELSSSDLLEITDKGCLVVTIKQKNQDPYQGVVEVESNNISDLVENFFEKSEQLKTIVVLKADKNMAAGIILQALPSCKASEDDWQRLRFVIDTLSLSEIKEADTQTIIERIFAEDDKTVYDVEETKFKCVCSYERTLGALTTIEESELESIAKEEKSITIDCGFCGKQYTHDAETVAALVKNKTQPN